MSVCNEPLWWNEDGSVRRRCEAEPCYQHVRRTIVATTPPVDLVNEPPHYKGARLTVRDRLVTQVGAETEPHIDVEPADVVEAFGLHANHYLATVFYYIVRAGKKGPALLDLQKARWFLDREIARIGGK